jgi:hypothetical protein
LKKLLLGSIMGDMKIVTNLAGQKFGRLTAISFIRKPSGNKMRVYWNCKCDCGKEVCTMAKHLVRGQTKSCGCLKIKHGHSNPGGKHSGTYNTWDNMLARCKNPNANNYEYYGGKGISVCERWKDFKNFLDDMGERPKGMTIERKDSNRNYEPENCKWATYKEQNNNLSKNIRITHNGETKTLSEWGRIFNVKPGTIKHRHARGRDISKKAGYPKNRKSRKSPPAIETSGDNLPGIT